MGRIMPRKARRRKKRHHQQEETWANYKGRILVRLPRSTKSLAVYAYWRHLSDKPLRGMKAAEEKPQRMSSCRDLLRHQSEGPRQYQSIFQELSCPITKFPKALHEFDFTTNGLVSCLRHTPAHQCHVPKHNKLTTTPFAMNPRLLSEWLS